MSSKYNYAIKGGAEGYNILYYGKPFKTQPYCILEIFESRIRQVVGPVSGEFIRFKNSYNLKPPLYRILS